MRRCCRNQPHIVCGSCDDYTVFCSYYHYREHLMEDHGLTEEEAGPFGLHTPYPSWWPPYEELSE